MSLLTPQQTQILGMFFGDRLAISSIERQDFDPGINGGVIMKPEWHLHLECMDLLGCSSIRVVVSTETYFFMNLHNHDYHPGFDQFNQHIHGV